MKHGEYVLEDMGIVCALGTDAATVRERLARRDTSGMKPLAGLFGGDATVFGFAAGLPHPASLAESAAVPGSPTRVGAILEIAAAQIADSVKRAAARFGSDRVGVAIGTSNSTMEEFTDNPDKIDMAYPAEWLRRRFSLGGPALAVSTACSSSAKSFAAARRMIESGECDAVITGGADAYTRTIVEGFHSLEALSGTLCRPLSPDRDGINLGEGAALFVMRRADPGDASDGDAPFPVLLAGVGESSDAYHLTAPDPEGRGAEAAMRAALADAGMEPGDIGFVNLHGTGTEYNDPMECAAAGRVFGTKPAADGADLADSLAVRAFSTKALTGHCLGAAGAIEAALCWLELRERRGACLSNSFAFGGSNASLVLKSP